MNLASNRLAIERKNWRKDHPHGFFARPATNKDGTLDILYFLNHLRIFDFY